MNNRTFWTIFIIIFGFLMFEIGLFEIAINAANKPVCPIGYNLVAAPHGGLLCLTDAEQKRLGL
jgi:hypothetical protein